MGSMSGKSASQHPKILSASCSRDRACPTISTLSLCRIEHPKPHLDLPTVRKLARNAHSWQAVFYRIGALVTRFYTNGYCKASPSGTSQGRIRPSGPAVLTPLIRPRLYSYTYINKQRAKNNVYTYVCLYACMHARYVHIWLSVYIIYVYGLAQGKEPRHCMVLFQSFEVRIHNFLDHGLRSCEAAQNRGTSQRSTSKYQPDRHPQTLEILSGKCWAWTAKNLRHFILVKHFLSKPQISGSFRVFG